MKKQQRKKRIIESGFVLLSAITLGTGVYSNSSSILLKPKAMIAQGQFEAIKNYDLMQVKNRLEERKGADIVKVVEEFVEESSPHKNPKEIEISIDMKLDQTIGIPKKDFVEWLSNFDEKHDPEGMYERNAEFIWDLCKELNINEIFVCGLMGNESGWGGNVEEQIQKHNYGSIMIQDTQILKTYETDEEGIRACVDLLYRCYINPEGKYYEGGTLIDIGPVYCPPDSNWAKKVYDCMEEVMSFR